MLVSNSLKWESISFIFSIIGFGITRTQSIELTLDIVSIHDNDKDPGKFGLVKIIAMYLISYLFVSRYSFYAFYFTIYYYTCEFCPSHTFVLWVFALPMKFLVTPFIRDSLSLIVMIWFICIYLHILSFSNVETQWIVIRADSVSSIENLQTNQMNPLL